MLPIKYYITRPTYPILKADSQQFKYCLENEVGLRHCQVMQLNKTVSFIIIVVTIIVIVIIIVPDVDMIPQVIQKIGGH